MQEVGLVNHDLGLEEMSLGGVPSLSVDIGLA